MNSDSYYVNVTWTPPASQFNQTHMLCLSAVRSNGLPIDQSCINLLPGYLPPTPIRSTAMPNQQLVYPSNMTWCIMFDSNVQRPSVNAYITFHEYTTELDVYQIDASESQEVVFGPTTNEIAIRPNFIFAERIHFFITFDRGIVNGLDHCGPGNEPITDKNFGPLKLEIQLHRYITFLESASITNANVTIRWKSNENVTWECNTVYSNVEFPVNCSEGYWMGFGLNAGLHILEVQAQDLAGNMGTLRHTFEVDLTPPVSTIVVKPDPVSNQQTSMLTFSCNELCTFNCQLLANMSTKLLFM